MSEYSHLTIADLSAARAFVQEQIADRKEDSKFIENTSTINELVEYEQRIRLELFSRVIVRKLKKQ
ncbi:hypothetical protein Q765_03230 [Flavobacterium rivuli WB 3.3-2 = DSM 21788]|uniref:Uncharacterized protein n=1 Tax=Flavobacterium rivuli WB 3.3-2 = DSM 21788 TaxID=1121895 RepID=A0A0A2M5Y5_9FLAO|nr:hypothetical protein [Flavobacterium rivuli]KGO88082.1 hypothetical protein Q765_03230 [Flavobacterium rivuli WB 3.3-2 = DSM 21788]